MSSSTFPAPTGLPQLEALERDRPERIPSAPRPAPALTVLVSPLDVLPVAGYLMRHGDALPLIPCLSQPAGPVKAFRLADHPVEEVEAQRIMAARRAAEVTANAGFSGWPVERLTPLGLLERLSQLGRCAVGSAALASATPDDVRRVAAALGAPVLALPPRAAPAGGPAVCDLPDAPAAVRAAARILATDKVVGVGTHGAGRFRAAAHNVGMTAHYACRAKSDAALDLARQQEGILVLQDYGDRPPALLAPALRAGRVVLLMPSR